MSDIILPPIAIVDMSNPLFPVMVISDGRDCNGRVMFEWPCLTDETLDDIVSNALNNPDTEDNLENELKMCFLDKEQKNFITVYEEETLRSLLSTLLI